MSVIDVQSTSIFPPGSGKGRAVSLTPWGAGKLLVLVWPNRAAYAFTQGVPGLAPVTVPAVSGVRAGYVDAASDGSGNAWLLGYTGPVTFLPPSGAGSLFALPTGASGEVFTGAAAIGAVPYFAAASGNLYTNSAGVIVAVGGGGFGELVYGLSTDGTKLYGALPASSNLGVYTLSNPTTGAVTKFATPMTRPSVIAASASGVAVGGWSKNLLASGATSIAAGSQQPGIAVAVNPTGNSVFLVTGTDPNWAITSRLAGTGAPLSLAWAPSGTQVLVTDPTNNKVQIFNLVTGSLQAGPVLIVSGAAQIAVTPTTGVALVTQGGVNNAVSVLSSTANVWSVSGAVSVASPGDIVTMSDTSAAVSSASGVAFLQFSNSVWSVSQAVAGLGFVPGALAADGLGGVFAVGTAGATGRLAQVRPTGIVATASWTGSATSVYFQQGQIAVGDAVSGVVRTFAPIGNTLVPGSTIAAPGGIAFIGNTGTSVWLCGTGQMFQTRFTAPYRLSPYQQGQVSIFNGSTFATASLGVEHQPSAMAWGVSGVWVTTIQDDLFIISPGAAILAQQRILPGLPQPAGTPLGLASLQFLSGGLLGASSMSNGIVSLTPTAPQPGNTNFATGSARIGALTAGPKPANPFSSDFSIDFAGGAVAPTNSARAAPVIGPITAGRGDPFTGDFSPAFGGP